MADRIQVTDRLVVGPQPQPEEIAQLKQQGFQTVINLRVENEEQKMLSPIDEGSLVEHEGLTYVHLPISGQQIRPEQVDDFRQFVDTLDGPIYAHCQRGKRAGALAMMYKGLREGWSGEETLQEARQAGCSCDAPALAGFVKEYVDTHGE